MSQENSLASLSPIEQINQQLQSINSPPDDVAIVQAEMLRDSCEGKAIISGAWMKYNSEGNVVPHISPNNY